MNRYDARLKDYYKILGVAPSADAQGVKKAFRGLAVKYHPDKNPDNTFAEAHFKEVQEAYAVLSNANKRKNYDEERWLSGMGTRMQSRQEITPQWILAECIKLSSHMSVIDTYRMSHRALKEYVLLILSDSHIAVLHNNADKTVNQQIVSEILKATRQLHAHNLQEIAARLFLLNDLDEATRDNINQQIKERKQHAKRDKYMPLVIFAIAVLLCVMMYLFGRMK